MEVIEFDLVINHDGQKIKATCQKFQVAPKPQIRIAFNFEKQDVAFTFYEVKEKGRRFFAWKMNNRKKDALLSSIESALNKSKKAKATLDLSASTRLG